MSLINNVLKDLNKRQQGGDKKQEYTHSALRISSSRPSLTDVFNRYFVNILLLLILVVFALIYFSHYPINKALPLKHLVSAQTILPQEEERAIAQVNGVTLERTIPKEEVQGSEAQSKAAPFVSQATVDDTFLLAHTVSNKNAVSDKTEETESSKTDEHNEGIQKNYHQLSEHQKMENQYEECVALITQENYSKAAIKLRALIQAYPQYIEARELLSALYIQSKQLNRADHLTQNNLSIAPEHLPFVTMRARVLASKGKTNQAIQTLANVSPNMNQHPDYYAFLAGLYEQSGKVDMATPLYKELVKVNPYNSVWWLGLAVSLERQHHNNAALTAYQEAMRTGGLREDLTTFAKARMTILEHA